MIRRRTLLGGVTGLLAATAARSAEAHPYHVSSAEARLHDGTLEVALKVTPEDLQEALRRLAGTSVDIDADDVAPLIRAYLRTHFTVRGPAGAVPMTWVGSEIGLEAAWLYFEYETPGAAGDYTLYSGVFFEIAPAQVNRVLVRRGKTTRTLRFVPGDEPRRLG